MQKLKARWLRELPSIEDRRGADVTVAVSVGAPRSEAWINACFAGDLQEGS